MPAWRRHPSWTFPALLATLPWWPLPLPPIALVWTGPLAWAPILASSVLALSELTNQSAPLARAAARWGAWQATALTLALVVLTAWADAPRSPIGDEPHYLLITQSLLKDGDLQVQNNYQQHDNAPYFSARLRPDYDRRGQNGAIYSIHPIGLPIAVLPGFALFGYRGAEATVLLLAALTGGLTWRIGWRATGDRPAAWFAWMVVVATPSFLLHSFSMFPENLGALVTAACTLLVVRLARGKDEDHIGTPTLVGVSILLGSFWWLHARFAILAAGYGALVLWLLLREGGAYSARLRRAAAFSAVPVLSAIGWLLFFRALYGEADPRGAYGGAIAFQADRILRGGLGIFFDQQYGLWPLTPALAAMAVGLVRPSQRSIRAIGWLVGGLVVAYVVATVSYRMDDMWWAGLPSAPARYAVVILPAFALFLAAAWARAGRATRGAWLALLLISMAVSALLVAVDRGDLAWNLRTAQARWLEWLAPLVNLPRGWPSFFWPFPALAPFVLHVVLWIGIPSWLALVVSAAGRRFNWRDGSARLMWAWWAALSMMAVTQAGWWINGTNGLDPARSQVKVLAASARGARVVSIAPLHLDRADALQSMTIRADEQGKYGTHPGIAEFVDVPAGRYRIRLALAEPRAGTITVKADRAFRFDRHEDVPAGLDPSVDAELPGGAGYMVLAVDEGLQPLVRGVQLTPLRVSRPGPSPKQAGVRRGSTELFFVDAPSRVDETGFLIGPHGTTRVVLAGPESERTLDLVLRNAGAPHVVAMSAGSYRREYSLEKDEERVVTLPVPEPGGVLHLSIYSESGVWIGLR